jgi:hypothetical protein
MSSSDFQGRAVGRDAELEALLATRDREVSALRAQLSEHAGRSILYVGAGTDAGPLLFSAFLCGFARIIYVDGLPSSDYSCPCVEHASGDRRERFSSVKKMQRCIAHQLRVPRSSWVPFRDSPNAWLLPLADGCELVYFFDTPEETISADKCLAELLPSVTRLLVKGYAPESIVPGVLPGLKEVFSTAHNAVKVRPFLQSLLMPILDQWFDSSNLTCVDKHSKSIFFQCDDDNHVELMLGEEGKPCLVRRPCTAHS